MPFSMPSTPLLNAQQASPYADLIKNMISAYQEGVKAKYAKPMAEQELQKAVLANKWYAPLQQSTIGLQGAQAGLAGAHTTNLDVDTQTNLLKQNFMRNRLSPGSPNMTVPNVPPGGSSMNGSSTYAPTGGASPMGNNDNAGMNSGTEGYGATPEQPSNYGAGGNPNRAPSLPPSAQINPKTGRMYGNDADTATDSSNAGGGASPAPMAGSGSNQVNTSTPKGGSAYGIDTPLPSDDDMVNQWALGIDTYTPKKANAQTQQQDQYNQYQKSIVDAVQQSIAANDVTQALAVYNKAMDASTYKGQTLGSVPSSGWHTAVTGDMKNEQAADTAAIQMLPGAISTLKAAMGGGQFSNDDMAYATKLKFDRNLDDETRRTRTAWVQAVDDRMKERARFLQKIGNPSSGAQKTQADILWAEYQSEFPLIDKKGNTVMRENLGNWPLFTTPKAIEAVKKNGTYVPKASERGTFWMQVPDGKGGSATLPIKKGKIETMLRKGAMPV